MSDLPLNTPVSSDSAAVTDTNTANRAKRSIRATAESLATVFSVMGWRWGGWGGPSRVPLAPGIEDTIRQLIALVERERQTDPEATTARSGRIYVCRESTKAYDGPGGEWDVEWSIGIDTEFGCVPDADAHGRGDG